MLRWIIYLEHNATFTIDVSKIWKNQFKNIGESNIL